MGLQTRKLAIHGGPRVVTREPGDLFRWPIVTPEDEAAVLAVLRAGAMSGTDITKQFEAEYAAWMGVPYALGCCNGTAALQAAFWACGVGAGDEIVCPSVTYWASAAPALLLGAAVNFADIDPQTLCLDPRDIERRIGPRTRAIVAVHYLGHPCDMDAILAVARRHNVRVIEDASHAHGALEHGRKVGGIGDIGCFSMMSGKGFAIGEGGMITTRDRGLFERCIAFGHYERTGRPSRYNPADGQITQAELQTYAGLPLGAAKHRLNQTCSAMGRVQLKYTDQRIQEIQNAMNRFWDLLEGVPGLRAHRTPRTSGSTMGAWYAASGLYRAEELGGLPLARFCEAVRAEGVSVSGVGPNDPLHLHPFFHTADIFHQGKPTMIAFGQRDVRQGPGSLKVSERVHDFVHWVPWFKHDRPELIAEYAEAYRKVAENAGGLLAAAKE